MIILPAGLAGEAELVPGLAQALHLLRKVDILHPHKTIIITRWRNRFESQQSFFCMQSLDKLTGKCNNNRVWYLIVDETVFDQGCVWVCVCVPP